MVPQAKTIPVKRTILSFVIASSIDRDIFIPQSGKALIAKAPGPLIRSPARRGLCKRRRIMCSAALRKCALTLQKAGSIGLRSVDRLILFNAPSQREADRVEHSSECSFERKAIGMMPTTRHDGPASIG